MGLFSASSPFDTDVDKATDGSKTSEDWALILDICDKVSVSPTGPKDCLHSILRRLNDNDPHVAINATILLDACVNNCGKNFHLEVASREFETEYRKLINKAHPKVKEKLAQMLKKWAEGDFKNDPQLNLIPSLYNKLKQEGMEFNASSEPAKKGALSKDSNAVSTSQEEEDIAKAIEMSLKESQASPKAKVSLYPVARPPSPTTSSSPKKDTRKVRALYDFQAVEDNELTFKAGEIIHVIDDSDPNWWKGSNQRGEGLFPANFVTADLTAEPEQFKVEQQKKSVQFKEEVQVKTVEEPEVLEIEPEKIDRALHLLHEADPSGERSDSEELASLEDQVQAMGPLIDQELEKIDRRHMQLSKLGGDLVEALNMYHTLMRELPPPPHMHHPHQQPHFLPPNSPAQFGAIPKGGFPYMPPPPHMGPPHQVYGPMGPPPPNFGPFVPGPPPDGGGGLVMGPPPHFPMPVGQGGPLPPPGMGPPHQGPPHQGPPHQGPPHQGPPHQAPSNVDQQQQQLPPPTTSVAAGPQQQQQQQHPQPHPQPMVSMPMPLTSASVPAGYQSLPSSGGYVPQGMMGSLPPHSQMSGGMTYSMAPIQQQPLFIYPGIMQ